jgi:hypothetical protein
MMMGFMQYTDLYHQFIKGKQPGKINSVLTFKTCGHYIHKTCSDKINGNKDFFLCQLCKTCVNCIFPVAVVSGKMVLKG